MELKVINQQKLDELLPKITAKIFDDAYAYMDRRELEDFQKRNHLLDSSSPLNDFISKNVKKSLKLLLPCFEGSEDEESLAEWIMEFYNGYLKPYWIKEEMIKDSHEMFSQPTDYTAIRRKEESLVDFYTRISQAKKDLNDIPNSLKLLSIEFIAMHPQGAVENKAVFKFSLDNVLKRWNCHSFTYQDLGNYMLKNHLAIIDRGIPPFPDAYLTRRAYETEDEFTIRMDKWRIYNRTQQIENLKELALRKILHQNPNYGPLEKELKEISLQLANVNSRLVLWKYREYKSPEYHKLVQQLAEIQLREGKVKAKRLLIVKKATKEVEKEFEGLDGLVTNRQAMEL